MSDAQSVLASLYEQPAYLLAVAEAAGATVELAESAGAVLPLLVCGDGVLRTVPGLPRPFGTDLSVGLGELAYALTDPQLAIAATLSPLAGGPPLARELSVRGARLVGERQICVTELGSDAVERCTGAVEITRLGRWFGRFQNGAGRGPGFGDVGALSEGHLEALAELQHYVVTVSDESGLAAAALFLRDQCESYCHAGLIRRDPAPGAEVVRCALATGIAEAARLGCDRAVLGGGRSDRPDDPLLALKRGLATDVLPRFSLTTAVSG